MVNSFNQPRFKTPIKSLFKTRANLRLRPRHQLFGWLTKRPPRRLQQRAIWYYGRQESKKWWRWLLILLAISLGALIWLLFFSPIFKLSDIQLSGLRRLTIQEVNLAIEPVLQERYFKSLPKNNYFLLPMEELTARLSTISIIEGVDLKRRLPNGLTIDIHERIASVVWQRGDKYVEVDLNGVAIKELTTSSIAELPLVADNQLEAIELGTNVTNSEIVKLAIGAQKNLLNIKIKNFIIGSETLQLIAVTDRGWQIYLTTQQSFDRQQQTLDTVLSSLTPDQQQRIEYIDIQLPDLPTYKLK